MNRDVAIGALHQLLLGGGSDQHCFGTTQIWHNAALAERGLVTTQRPRSAAAGQNLQKSAQWLLPQQQIVGK
jgi:hypothetical protein